MVIVFILSLLLTTALVPLLKSAALRMNIVDLPDARKVHLRPMPKTGGLSMAMGAFIPLLLWVPRNDFVTGVFTGALIIVLFGLADDIRPMNFKQKIIPQVLAALWVIFWGGVRIKCLDIHGYDEIVLPLPLSVILTLFVMVGVTNAVNLSDGLDGLAGGISMLTFIMIAFLAYRCGNHCVALMAIAVVAAIAGFLRYNAYPADLFMGDAGSQLLGFLSVVFVLAVTQENTPYSRTLALPLIGFPVLDTLMVMAQRIFAGRSPFKADKNHIHHRLLSMGYSHARAVWIIYLIQAVFLSLAFIFRFYPGWVHILLFTGLAAPICLGLSIAAPTRKQGRQEPITSHLHSKKPLKTTLYISFTIVRLGLPLVLGFQCMIPESIPAYLSLLAACLICLVSLPIFKGEPHTAGILRFSLVLIIPLILYLGETAPAPWFTTGWYGINTAALVLLVISALLTQGLTRRKKGVHLTATDILIFIVVIIFPNLPGVQFQDINGQYLEWGPAAAKALSLFFCLDLLSGELRRETRTIQALCLGLPGLVILRGLFF